MVSMMVYDPHTEEHELIRGTARQTAAVLTDEMWRITFLARQGELERYLADSPLLDICCYDVSGRGVSRSDTSGSCGVAESINRLEEIRRSYQDMLLMVIADPQLSPMEYIRPTILASSLLIRPITAQRLRGCMQELVEKLVERTGSGKEEERFVVETKEGKTFVPLDQVYYFEAREKKIYLRMKNQEIAFYETIENLDQRLPDQFIRCHRSFIINKDRIERVLLSKNVVYLQQDMEIPLSRSYKPVLKELA